MCRKSVVLIVSICPEIISVLTFDDPIAENYLRRISLVATMGVLCLARRSRSFPGNCHLLAWPGQSGNFISRDQSMKLEAWKCPAAEAWDTNPD